LNKDLESLISGNPIYLPTYDDSTDKQFARTNTLINSSPIIIVEGFFSLFEEEIRQKANLKIYIEIDDDLRLVRRLKRYDQGLKEGKFRQPIEQELARYENYVKKNHETYVRPTKKYADLIINNNSFEGNVERIVGVMRGRLEDKNVSSENKKIRK
jgi:uridine kinase